MTNFDKIEKEINITIFLGILAILISIISIFHKYSQNEYVVESKTIVKPLLNIQEFPDGSKDTTYIYKFEF